MPDSEQKPKRLYFKTYLQLIHNNSIGTAMFRNFYIETSEGTMDAVSDGANSCAFYVSSVLVILKQLTGVHGTIKSTVADLEENNWQKVDEPDLQPGDVIIWRAMEFEDGIYEHIGFYVGDSKAVSTSQQEKRVVEHDLHFGDAHRPIELIFRQAHWDK